MKKMECHSQELRVEAVVIIRIFEILQCEQTYLHVQCALAQRMKSRVTVQNNIISFQ